MIKFLPLIFLLLIFDFCFCQKLTKKKIDNHFEKLDSATSIKRKDKWYILKGLPFDQGDSAKLDSALSGFILKYLVSLEILKCPDPTLCHLFYDVVLMRFATQQKARTKRKILHSAHQFFNKHHSSISDYFEPVIKNFMLIIDNRIIPPLEIEPIMKSLKRKDILYIVMEATESKMNADAAIVKIWMKPK